MKLLFPAIVFAAAASLPAMSAPVDGLLRHTRISPMRVVASSSVKDAGALVSPRFGQVPEGPWAKGSGCVMANSGEGSWLILDFGRELHGGVRILSGAPSRKGARIRLRFGDRVAFVDSLEGHRDMNWYSLKSSQDTDVREIAANMLMLTSAMNRVQNELLD